MSSKSQFYCHPRHVPGEKLSILRPEPARLNNQHRIWRRNDKCANISSAAKISRESPRDGSSFHHAPTIASTAKKREPFQSTCEISVRKSHPGSITHPHPRRRNLPKPVRSGE